MAYTLMKLGKPISTSSIVQFLKSSSGRRARRKKYNSNIM